MAKVSQLKKKEAAGLTATLAEIVGSVGAVNTLMRQPTPARFSFKFGKLVKAVGKEFDEYEEARKALLERLGTKPDPLPEGEWAYLFENGKREEFDRELKELLDTEVTIPGERFKVEELGNINVPTADLMALAWAFEE